MKRCLPIFLLLLSVNAHGALNKWVDAEGNIHYSDEPPPPNVKTQTLVAPVAASGVAAQKNHCGTRSRTEKSTEIEGRN